MTSDRTQNVLDALIDRVNVVPDVVQRRLAKETVLEAKRLVDEGKKREAGLLLQELLKKMGL